MSEIKGQKFTVKHNSPLLEYLYEIFPQQSKKGVKAYLSNEQVVVNGVNTTAFDKPLREGDSLIILPKGVSMANELNVSVKKEAEELGVEVVYEDEHIIVVNKRSGMPTVSTGRDRTKKGMAINDKGDKAKLYSQEKEKTVYSILTDYVKTKAKSDRKNLKIVNHDTVKIWIVHRLDRDTSGLLLFAKDERTKDLLQSKWNDLVYERKYIAYVEGFLSPEQGTIRSWLTENPVSLKVSSSPVDNGGQLAITHYKTIQKIGNYSMVEFHLETGRKNQIRVQMETAAHPIAGDKKYDANTNPIGRLALHASTLVFKDPYSQDTLSFTANLPKEFKKIK
jgi:23S rRNA pseudouridine1911/1915/1917 synthase